MEITLLKSKIHRAVVTQADLDYVGSITIDSALMEAAGIIEYERVEIADVTTVTALPRMSLPEARARASCA